MGCYFWIHQYPGCGRFDDTVDIANGLSAGSLAIDSNTLYVDAVNNRVGIVNSSPAYPLDVSGNVRLNGLVGINGAPGSEALKITGNAEITGYWKTTTSWDVYSEIGRAHV